MKTNEEYLNMAFGLIAYAETNSRGFELFCEIHADHIERLKEIIKIFTLKKSEPETDDMMGDQYKIKECKRIFADNYKRDLSKSEAKKEWENLQQVWMFENHLPDTKIIIERMRVEAIIKGLLNLNSPIIIDKKINDKDNKIENGDLVTCTINGETEAKATFIGWSNNDCDWAIVTRSKKLDKAKFEWACYVNKVEDNS
jgi:hypothetical protein